MMDLELFQRVGIVPGRIVPGSNGKALCPKCSAGRKHKWDRCLSFLLTADGLVWDCKNCGWRGRIGNADQRAELAGAPGARPRGRDAGKLWRRRLRAAGF